MIEIKKENTFKVLKPELFNEGEALLDKYPLFWTNTAMTPTHLCFIKSFGSKDDMRFGTFNSTWFGFNPETNELKLHCTSYGGLAGFVFTEESLKNKDLNNNDKQCIGFTLNLLRDLEQEGVIEL
ncbi:MAG: hypothetical protein E7F47_01840 [Peptoniphilus harei]|nr:hypothetical protein [Peptoniphilus harei]